MWQVLAHALDKAAAFETQDVRIVSLCALSLVCHFVRLLFISNLEGKSVH